MVRGIIKVKCPKCGTRFKTLDIEWHATIESAPVKCPHCGHVFQPGIRVDGKLTKLIGILLNKFKKHG